MNFKTDVGVRDLLPRQSFPIHLCSSVAILGNLCLFFRDGTDILLGNLMALKLSELFSRNPGLYLMSINASVVICAFSFKHGTDVLWISLTPIEMAQIYSWGT